MTTQSNSCETIQGNLSEIYMALHDAKPNHLPLYAPSEHTVCHSRSWRALWNRYWYGEQPAAESLKVVSHTINDLFNKCVVSESYRAYHQRVLNWVKLIDNAHTPETNSQVVKEGQKERYRHFTLASFGETTSNEHIDKYLTDYDQEMQNPTLDNSRIDRIRGQINACSQATREFWKFFTDPSFESLISPIKNLVPQNSFSAINNQSLFKAFKRAQALVDLEGILEDDIPFVAIAKLSKPEQLSISEKLQVQKWVNRLNEKKHEIDFKTFTESLQEIVSIINIEGHYPTTVENLILQLDGLNCEIIQKEDPDHMKWREALIKGSKIEYKGQTLTLGDELGGDKIEDNQYRIFSLEGPEHANQVIKIAHNRFQLKIEAAKIKDEKWHWGIQPAEVVEDINAFSDEDVPSVPGLDPDGRFAIVEKLDITLADLKWSSTSTQLTSDDLRKALVISNHMYCMQQWQATPDQLNPKHLMIDSQGVLKSTRLLKKNSFNYNALEQFCYLVGKGNTYIIDFLMNVSELIKHKVAKFYRDAVEYTLATGETNLIGSAQPKKFRSAQNEERVEELCKEAKELRLECFKTIKAHLRRKNINHGNDEQLKTAIHAKLVELYKASSTPGIICPTIKENVIQHFINPERPLQALINPPIDYYEAFHQRLKQYNEAALAESTNTPANR